MACTTVEAHESIVEKFVTDWDDETPYVIEDDQFDSKGVDAWCRISIREVSAPQRSFGVENNRRFTRRGFVYVQIFQTPHSTERQGLELAEKARDIFEGEKIEDTQVTFLEATIDKVGLEKGGFVQWNVRVRFVHDIKK